MGRGIDFKGVNMVINYDFPPTAISYIHRIGIVKNIYNCVYIYIYIMQLSLLVCVYACIITGVRSPVKLMNS